MKKDKTTLIIVLFFFMGLSVLLYPTISNLYNRRVQSRAIVDYDTVIKNYDDSKYSEILNEAEAYNQEIMKLEDPFNTYDTIDNYEKVLNIDNTGMMGYIEIDKIDVKLPIYHGTSNGVLSKAVGHLEGSSLPIGGIGNHTVLSAHRGLPSATLFTDLDKLEKGDIFTITILNQKLTYEIDQILIVEPDKIDELQINSGHDYVTLITCTPYGINTHRMLVRGSRIENTLEEYVTTEAYKINSLMIIPLVALPIILILVLIIMFKPIKKKDIDKNKYLYPSKYKAKKKSSEVMDNEEK
ncbi:MAG: class C sortase [Bacilli bacterium]|nr:class C sortase [Bacilli bacterium]